MQFGKGDGIEERKGWDLFAWKLRELSWKVLPWKVLAGRRQRRNAEKLVEQLRRQLDGLPPLEEGKPSGWKKWRLLVKRILELPVKVLSLLLSPWRSMKEIKRRRDAERLLGRLRKRSEKR